MAAIYGRDADRLEVQDAFLGDLQKGFANIDWRLENAPPASGPASHKSLNRKWCLGRIRTTDTRIFNRLFLHVSSTT